MKEKKYFNKYAKIVTKDNRIFNIKKMRLYIGGKINYYGKQYVIIPENKEKDNMHIVEEVYSLDNNRLRFLSDTIKNPIIFDTIEYSSDHSLEKPIKVIQEYEDAKTEIISIPDIKKFESDLILYENNKIQDINTIKEKEKKRSLFQSLILKK